MKTRLLYVFIIMILLSSVIFAGDGIDRFDRINGSKVLNENVVYDNSNVQYVNLPLILEGERIEPDFWFGPEVSTTLSGYYDYQTNGMCHHYVNRFNPSILHAVFMTSTDSSQQSPSRRTQYAFSTDEGASWVYFGDVPTIRSGFCSMTTRTDGAAVIANHYEPTAGNLTTGVHIDVVPGAGTFTSYLIPPATNYVWPGIARMSNGTNFLIAAETYASGNGTDTGIAVIFNSTSNTFQNLKKIFSQATSQLNMRWTYAAGPNNNAIYVVDAISDEGGNFGLNRMFIFKTTDGGVSWDNGSVLFNPVIQGSDTLTPHWGLDAIYDGAGNYYVAFNTTSPTGYFSAAKMWVSKNGGTPSLVAQHSGTNGIPEAANTVLHADAGISTIDHPTLGLSADGSTLFIAFSVQYEADTLNGFNKCHIYYSFAPTSTMVFNPPIKVTNSGPNSFDERYTSMIQSVPDLGGNFGSTCLIVYQKDPQPGNCVAGTIGDGAPMSRSTLVSRKIYQANSPIGIKEVGGSVPEEFALLQNYPNPFNPNTKIRFALPISTSVTLRIYDAAGRLTGVLINNELLKAGIKEISFNAASLASGVYFFVIETPEFRDTKKMVLVK